MVTPEVQSVPECTLEVEEAAGESCESQLKKGCFGFISGDAEPGVGGVGVLIQITPQLRILVAVDAIATAGRASILWHNYAGRKTGCRSISPAVCSSSAAAGGRFSDETAGL